MGCTPSQQRVTPLVAAHISVQPAPPPNANTSSGHNSSLESSTRGIVSPRMVSGSRKDSSDSVSKVSHSRPGSQSSKRALSASIRAGSSYNRRLGSGRRFGQGGVVGNTRPISSVSRQNATSAKGFRKIGSSAGLPLQRDVDRFDLNASGRTHVSRINAVTFIASSPDSEIESVVYLRVDPKRCQEKPPTCCQFCGNEFTTLGIRVPLLLLCGHSYCSNCLDKACENYPSALRCGICSILTPLDQQTTENLPRNEAILDLLGSKEFAAMTNERNVEMCAECERKPASTYCSDCSASYCNYCSRNAHEGSRVRSKHKPVPINLKPRPQPTCRKHPGQSCVLYCETEKQPMCVLCKFYGQHRFHRYELLSKVASKYCSGVSEKLSQMEKMERDLDVALRTLSQSVEEIDSSARKAQERLERHFAELRKSYLASLERREAVLLTLVDRQVEVRQEMLEERRKETAAARARVLAAREEATRLLTLNPVSALLTRKHMDATFDQVLKQTAHTPEPPIQPEVPLSLLPDITPSMVQTLNQHGAVLQLPAKPWFVDITVTNNTISLQWEVMDQGSDVTADRTLTYSLHCYADVPFKLKAKLNFKKRFVGKLVTPESGFEDMSERSVTASSENKSAFPSLPPSLLGSRKISLVTMGSGGQPEAGSHDKANQPTNQNAASWSHDQARESHQEAERERLISIEDMQDSTSQTSTHNTSEPEISQPQKKPSLVLKPTAAKNITSLLPEPIRLPKPADTTTEAKLPQVVKPAVAGGAISRPATQKATIVNQASTVLNLPPLIVSKPKLKESDMELVSESAVFADSEDTQCDPTPITPRMEPVGEDATSKLPKMSRGSSSSSISELSGEYHENEFTNVGRFCKGYLFEEIYCGEKGSFHYSGLVPGATYYFRVRCHNAAGWGHWSDTVKCMTTSAKRK